MFSFLFFLFLSLFLSFHLCVSSLTHNSNLSTFLSIIFFFAFLNFFLLCGSASIFLWAVSQALVYALKQDLAKVAQGVLQLVALFSWPLEYLALEACAKELGQQ